VEALKAIGAKCVTLGRRILRTETAGFCALTLVMGALGEM
jgi:16S rRNA (uracil1498-N3)-methyltransferase